ncbi:MAG: hypothetical protein V4587_04975, partial [Acidobacteriota bacterium]
LGLALILLAWRQSVKVGGGPPAWSPMPAVIGCLTLTVILGIGLRERERDYLKTRTQNAMASLAQTIKGSFDQQTSEFERLARSWADKPENAV